MTEKKILTEEDYHLYTWPTNPTSRYTLESEIRQIIHPTRYWDNPTGRYIDPVGTGKSIRLRFENTTGTHHKWWEIELNIPAHADGANYTYTTKWARIGKQATAKATVTKVIGTGDWSAVRRMITLVNAKTRKGYVQVTTPTLEPPAPPLTTEEIRARAVSGRFRVFI